jgi:hypothetical protein
MLIDWVTGYDQIDNYLEQLAQEHDNRGRPSPHIVTVKSSLTLLPGTRMRVMNSESTGLCGPSSIHMYMNNFKLYASHEELSQGARDINTKLVASGISDDYDTTLSKDDLKLLLDKNKSYHWTEAHFALAADAFDLNIHLWKVVGVRSLPVTTVLPHRIAINNLIISHSGFCL